MALVIHKIKIHGKQEMNACSLSSLLIAHAYVENPNLLENDKEIIEQNRNQATTAEALAWAAEEAFLQYLANRPNDSNARLGFHTNDLLEEAPKAIHLAKKLLNGSISKESKTIFESYVSNCRRQKDNDPLPVELNEQSIKQINLEQDYDAITHDKNTSETLSPKELLSSLENNKIASIIYGGHTFSVWKTNDVFYYFNSYDYSVSSFSSDDLQNESVPDPLKKIINLTKGFEINVFQSSPQLSNTQQSTTIAATNANFTEIFDESHISNINKELASKSLILTQKLDNHGKTLPKEFALQEIAKSDAGVSNNKSLADITIEKETITVKKTTPDIQTADKAIGAFLVLAIKKVLGNYDPADIKNRDSLDINLETDNLDQLKAVVDCLQKYKDLERPFVFKLTPFEHLEKALLKPEQKALKDQIAQLQQSPAPRIGSRL